MKTCVKNEYATITTRKVQRKNKDAGQLETAAELAFDCRVLVLFTHADVQTQTHMHCYAALGLQVCILLRAAKALCGFLESRFFGGRNVCRRRCLLVIGVRLSYW